MHKYVSGAHQLAHALGEAPQLHARLERYVAAVRAERDGAWLAASVLHKRALSSAWSLARSVERRLEALAAKQLATVRRDSRGCDGNNYQNRYENRAE